MRFTVAGSKIICSRIDNTVETTERHRRVVDFDANVGKVPPHVEARLTRNEVEELERFLDDRKRIQANPAEINMLEALPELLDEATDVLSSADRLNESIFRRLHSSIGRLIRTLEKVTPRENGQVTPIQTMRKSEALKEKLENIKQEL